MGVQNVSRGGHRFFFIVFFDLVLGSFLGQNGSKMISKMDKIGTKVDKIWLQNIRASYLKNFATICTFCFFVVLIEVAVTSNRQIESQCSCTFFFFIVVVEVVVIVDHEEEKVQIVAKFFNTRGQYFFCGYRLTSVKCQSSHLGKDDSSCRLSLNHRNIVRKIFVFRI